MLKTHKENAQLRLCRERYIPSKPALLTEIQQLMVNREPDVLSLSELVSRDVGLSSAVLKSVNSAFFGLRSHISDIRQTVVMLGVDNVVNLVSAHEMKRALNQKSCLTLERFWDTASEVAKASVWIARELDVPVPLEDVYAVGLFHDCGIPIMASCFETYRNTLDESNGNYHRSIIEIEESYHDLNHAVAGFMFAETWDLPRFIQEVILQHHDLQAWESLHDEQILDCLAVLKLAENLVDRKRRQVDNVDWPHFAGPAMQRLKLTAESYPAVEERLIGLMQD
ncbi:MAG: HDOD domain-containing protein [Candidatus Thiodiazotropha sp.]